MSHYVYRCFDADGGLLYVGCARNVPRRLSQHRQGKARASQTLSALMASHTVEGPFASRSAGEAAEQAAIAAEAPLLNIVHSGMPGWIQDVRLAEYLTELGLPLSVAGLHRCENCDHLLGRHVPRGLCTDCRESPAFARAFAKAAS